MFAVSATGEGKMGAAEQQKNGAWWAMVNLGTAMIGGLFGGIFGMLNSGGQKGPAEITSRDDRRDIQGEWVVIMGEQAGRHRPVLNRVTFVFKADRVTVTGGLGEGPHGPGRFVLDPSRKAIDIYDTDTDIAGHPKDSVSVSAGIYRLEETHLTLCIATGSAPRPKEIESTDKNRCDLLVLERP
jgi:uncharacterized protein (TIGR03067 family)